METSPAVGNLTGGDYHPVHRHAVLKRRLHDILSGAVLAEGAACRYRL